MAPASRSTPCVTWAACSTGKMGHAIAEAAVRRGYDVTLVTTAEPTHPAVKLIQVETAEEMLAAVAGVEPDIAIMAAASPTFGRDLLRSPRSPEQTDFLPSSSPRPRTSWPRWCDEIRGPSVGFAETDGIERAVDKARNKDVDILVYNDVTEPGSGFGTDTNRVVFIGRSGDTEELPLLAKSEVAERLLDRGGRPREQG